MSLRAEALGTIWPERASRDGPLPPLLLLLTVVTGLVDAASFLKLGHVFVANMTGNVVFLGFAIAGASGLSIGCFARRVGLVPPGRGSPGAESPAASPFTAGGSSTRHS